MDGNTYTAQAGDTLNGIASKFGFANYKDAGVSTVPSGNFDQINPGDKITLSNYAKAPAVQQTTTSVRQQATQNAATLQNKVAQVAPPPPVTQDPNAANNSQDATKAKANGITQPGASQLAGTVTNDIDNGDGTHTVSYADGTQDRVKVATNGDGSSAYTVLSPEAGVKYDADKQTAAANAKAQSQVDYATTTLDGLKAQSDAATAALIDSIKSTYAARITLTQDSNSRVLAAKDQEGIRSGRARYAAGLQEGILSDEEQQGIARVATLQGEMISLIAQAQKAQNDEDITLFNDRMDALSKSDTALQTSLQNIQKNAFDSLKQMQDQKTADINNAKTQQDAVLAKAKVVAPALAEKLAALSDDASRAAFIGEYSKQSGLSTDVLMGAIESASQDNAKSALDLKNIQSQIDDRVVSERISQQNANTASQNASNSKKTADGTDEVNNIVNGISGLGDVDAAKKQTVKAKLQKLGLYDSTPPAWYVQAQNDIAGSDILPAKLKTMWDAYRTKATADSSA